MVAVAAAAAFAAAAVQSATGFGFALVLGPVLFGLLDPVEAVVLLVALGFGLNLAMLAGGSRARHVRWRILAPALLAALPGLAAGAVLLAELPKPALQIAVGAAVLAAAGLQLRRPEARPAPGLGTAYGAGLVSGALTTATSVSGPPLVLWLERHSLRPEELRATLAAAFLALNVCAAVTLVAAGAGPPSVSLLLPLAALTLAGHLAGSWVFGRLEPARFRLAVLVLVAAAGAASVLAGLGGL